MAEPSYKSEAIEQHLIELVGSDRRNDIRANRCRPKPIGCGGSASQFRNELSQREYTISGLCQDCQDSVFGAN